MKMNLTLNKNDSLESLINKYEICKSAFSLNKKSLNKEESSIQEAKLQLVKDHISQEIAKEGENMRINLTLKKGDTLETLTDRYEICKKAYEISERFLPPEQSIEQDIKLALTKAFIDSLIQDGFPVNAVII